MWSNVKRMGKAHGVLKASYFHVLKGILKWFVEGHRSKGSYINGCNMLDQMGTLLEDRQHDHDIISSQSSPHPQARCSTKRAYFKKTDRIIELHPNPNTTLTSIPKPHPETHPTPNPHPPQNTPHPQQTPPRSIRVRIRRFWAKLLQDPAVL